MVSVDENNNSNRRLTKNEKRRLREKKSQLLDDVKTSENLQDIHLTNQDENIIVEYISPIINFDNEEFKNIFQKFLKPEDLTNPVAAETADKKDDVKLESSTDNQKLTSTEISEKKLSKKKLKMQSRLSVAELKQLVNRSDVVEAHDVTSSDPRLLVLLKALRNTIHVPRHWCAKRKYLQGKRGIEKPPFQLPDFIAETGISKIRESLLEQEALKKSKQRARERVQPKMGRIDIDYQVLHDAFFKYQTKPKLTIHGDIYYEGKEFEVQIKDAKPGFLSTELKEALGMTSESSPPPYLVNMQRYGPPPSYPTLKIPGLNAPIPSGASFGYQAGGWGKPPVDEYGRPIYGDVFGLTRQNDDMYNDTNVDKVAKWGEVTVVEKEDEDEGEEEEEADGEVSQVERKQKDVVTGTETPIDGIASMTTGLETPDVIDLRKRAIAGTSSVSGLETPMFDTPTVAKDLYKVIPEKDNSVSSGQLFSSERAYAISATPISGNDNKVADQEQDAQKKKRRLDSNASVQKLKDFKF